MDCSQFISIFFKGIHYCGYWPDQKETFYYKLFGIFSFSFFCVTYNISIIMGAFTVAHVNLSDGIFLFGHFLQISIVSLRTAMLYWNRNQINQMLPRFYQNQQNYERQMLRKFEILSKIFRAFVLVCVIGITACYCVPIFTHKRTLPLAIWFPLDWENDLFYYTLAYIYVLTSHTILSIAAIGQLFFVYIMFSQSVELENIGNIFENLSPNKNEQILINSIKAHKNIKQNITLFLESFSVLFLVQISFSSIFICSVVIGLLYQTPDSNVIYIYYTAVFGYSFFEVFVISYLGNEIMLRFSHLSSSLYKSQWTNQPASYQKMVITFMEILNHPEPIIVGKIFKLDLETFTSILKTVYSIFNVIRTMKDKI